MLRSNGAFLGPIAAAFLIALVLLIAGQHAAMLVTVGCGFLWCVIWIAGASVVQAQENKALGRAEIGKEA